MNELVFHSFFSDDHFRSLKHALFYFDKIILPSNDFVVHSGDGEDLVVRYINLIPEHVSNDIEFLVNEGFVELHDFKESNYGDIRKLNGIIINQINERYFNNYNFSDFKSICNFIDINPTEKNFNAVAQTIIFITSICLGETTLGKRIPCIDDRIVYDLLNKGLKSIFDVKKEKELLYMSEIKKIQSNLMAQNLISLYLPSFDFKSFEDVLDLKEHFKEDIMSLNQWLEDLPRNFDVLPWEPEFDVYVNNFIKKRIDPEIKKIKEKIKFSPKSFVKNAFTQGMHYISFSLALHQFFPSMIQEMLVGSSIVSVINSILQEKGKIKTELEKIPMSLFVKPIK